MVIWFYKFRLLYQPNVISFPTIFFVKYPSIAKHFFVIDIVNFFSYSCNYLL